MGQVQTSGFQPICAPAQKSGHSGDRALQRSLRDSVAEALGVTAKGHGVHGLAIALRDKLATAPDSKDAVTSVMASIDRALDEAAKRLAAQGASQKDIDAGIAKFKNKLAREIGELSGNVATPPDAAATQKLVIAAREEVRERFSLDVLTSEGDKVTIRFASLKVTEAAAAAVSNDTGSVTKIEGNVISRGRFQVEVDGELNDSERTAIADLLDKVDDIAADFFGGDAQAAFAAAGRVGLESDALGAFDLKLSYSRSLAAVKTYASNAQLGSETAPAAAKPASDPKLVATPTAKTATTDPVSVPAEAQSASTPVVDLAAVQPDAKNLVTAPASEGTAVSAAVAHNAAKASSAIETITQFAKDVLDRLDEKDESKATKFSLRWKVEFMIKAFGSVALNPVEQKAAEALGIALDAQNPGA